MYDDKHRDSHFSSSCRKIMITFETYPELLLSAKAQEHFIDLFTLHFEKKPLNMRRVMFIN